MNIVVLRWRAQPVTTSDITMEKNRVGSGRDLGQAQGPVPTDVLYRPVKLLRLGVEVLDDVLQKVRGMVVGPPGRGLRR